MKHNQGYTLVFALAVMVLLAGVAAMLALPSLTEARRVDLHYRNVQAQCLSLAGIESARHWAAQGMVTNELYLLANGIVDTNMEKLDDKNCRIVSVGRVRTPWRNRQVTVRTETIVPIP